MESFYSAVNGRELEEALKLGEFNECTNHPGWNESIEPKKVVSAWAAFDFCVLKGFWVTPAIRVEMQVSYRW